MCNYCEMKGTILLAVGHIDLEECLKSRLSDYNFLKPVSYREAILNAMNQEPDIIIIRELLMGNENIVELIYKIVTQHPKCRIIFLAGARPYGDKLLATLVECGVYDIICNQGGSFSIEEILTLVECPNTFADVSQFKPKPIIDENSGEIIFEAPKVVEKIKKVKVKNNNDERIANNTKMQALDEKTSLEDNLNKPQKNETNVEPVKFEDEEDTKPIEFEDEEDTKPIEFEDEEDTKPIEFEDDTNDDSESPLKVNPDKQVKYTPRDNFNLIGSNEDLVSNKKVDSKKIENNKKNTPQSIASNESVNRDNTIAKKKNSIFSLVSNVRKNLLDGKNNALMSRQKIITFMGSIAGVGNTTVAFNTALTLAKNECNVIFIELDSLFPSIPYIYDIIDETSKSGIDTALDGLNKSKYKLVNDAILNVGELKKKNSDYSEQLKKLPDSLNFMFYSKKYVSKNKAMMENIIHSEKLKDLYFYLTMQCGFDYVVLDIGSNVFCREVFNSIVYCNQLFITITQDICSIANIIQQMKELKKKDLDFSGKTNFIINKYENASLSIKDTVSLLENDNILTLPNLYRECIDSEFKGIPLTIYHKKNNLTQAFNKILNVINN